MPKSEHDFMLILETILKELSTKRELQTKVAQFKFTPDINYTNRETMKNSLQSHLGGLLPALTLYPISGKENAEFVLRYFYQLFESIEGLDLSPNNCIDVTSLISYEQGDPKYKFGTAYDSYYDDTDCKALYRPDFIKKDSQENYELILEDEKEEQIETENISPKTSWLDCLTPLKCLKFW